MSHRAAAVLTVSLFGVRDLAVRLREERGQGTVEYVALILLVAGVLAGVVMWAKTQHGDNGIGKAVSTQITKAIDSAGDNVAAGNPKSGG